MGDSYAVDVQIQANSLMYDQWLASAFPELYSARVSSVNSKCTQ